MPEASGLQHRRRERPGACKAGGLATLDCLEGGYPAAGQVTGSLYRPRRTIATEGKWNPAGAATRLNDCPRRLSGPQFIQGFADPA